MVAAERPRRFNPSLGCASRGLTRSKAFVVGRCWKGKECKTIERSLLCQRLWFSCTPAWKGFEVPKAANAAFLAAKATHYLVGKHLQIVCSPSFPIFSSQQSSKVQTSGPIICGSNPKAFNSLRMSLHTHKFYKETSQFYRRVSNAGRDAGQKTAVPNMEALWTTDNSLCVLWTNSFLFEKSLN